MGEIDDEAQRTCIIERYVRNLLHIPAEHNRLDARALIERVCI